MSEWRAMDDWCAKQCARIIEEWTPYIESGGDLDAPKFRTDLGQSKAFHRMRSFIHGAKDK